jgi:poly(A) polymerase
MQWMLDLGLLEVLLPEAYAMLTAGSRGLGDFGRILPAIDRKVAQGKPLSDTGLLAALLLPKVMLRRHDVEAMHQRPMSRAAIEVLVQEEVAPFLGRFTLSNVRAQQIQHALTGFNRLCEPHWTLHQRIQFARKASFADALLLFELLVDATGEGREALAVWQVAARHKPPLKAAAEGGGRTRPRRRRRRRGGATPPGIG